MITVYLDLDGVVFDFMKVYRKLLGEWETAEKGQNFTKAIYEYKIFEDLPLCGNAEHLLAELRKGQDLGLYRIEILSSTGSPNKPEQQLEVIRQKRIALQKHGITFPDNYTIHKGNKKLFANVKSILIDDHTENVNDFTQAGGCGILYVDGMDLTPIYDMVDYLNYKESVGIY